MQSINVSLIIMQNGFSSLGSTTELINIGRINFFSENQIGGENVAIHCKKFVF